MAPLKRTRDLALSLVAKAADPGAANCHTEAATLRVYEMLRRQLGTPVGVDGFQAIASRALALARTDFPWLDAVQVGPDGVLSGLDLMAMQADSEEAGEAGILLIAQMLGLFLTLLGEATTLRLIEDLRLQADVQEKLPASPEAGRNPVVHPLLMDEGFDELLLEINQLRGVSDRLEVLAATYPGMEDGLVSVAASIRNIATVLDVFTLIRSRAGGPQDELPNLETNRYMN
jgi:hypothetical protein